MLRELVSRVVVGRRRSLVRSSLGLGGQNLVLTQAKKGKVVREILRASLVSISARYRESL